MLWPRARARHPVRKPGGGALADFSASTSPGGALSAAIATSLDKLSSLFNSTVVSMDRVRRTGIAQFCTRRVNAPLTKVAERVLISWRNFFGTTSRSSHAADDGLSETRNDGRAPYDSLARFHTRAGLLSTNDAKPILKAPIRLPGLQLRTVFRH